MIYLTGQKSLKEIGEEVNTSSEAVRLFAVSLEKAGLIEYVSNTKGEMSEKIILIGRYIYE